MRKSFLMIVAMLCVTMSFAQSYGILVNGKMYFAADYQGPDGAGEGFEEYLAHVKVKSGDYCQLYNAVTKDAWVKPLNSWSETGFTYDAANQRYNVSVTGCYDFYIKLKWDADELYIGPGTVECGDGVDITKEDPTPSYNGSVPANCPAVMLQAFYWDSYQMETSGSKTEVYGRTKWVDHLNKKAEDGVTSRATEIGQWFDLVWLPPMSKASGGDGFGGVGYMPVCYSDFQSDWGSYGNLTKLINTFHTNGARVVADIVINHAVGASSWCTFETMNFAGYGTFKPTAAWICQTDEMNSDDAAGSCKGKATGAADDGYGSEANYGDARDWDHTNAEVRNMFKAYLKWLRNDIKIDGFRYDYCKGFHNSHINEYNREAQIYFSVMEMWDGNPATLMSHLNDAGYNTLTFDFATKYTAFNNGIAADDYSKLQGAGLPGAGKARYAVTFLDSHDSFLRDGNEFCGEGNSMTVCRDKIMQCYAYLLSMPGVPCVFYPHWVTFKDPIKKMINARYKTGVHSESAVNDEAGNGYYKATVTGTNGEIRVLIGPNSGYNSTPSGYTLAVKGVNYGVYYKTTSARGDKNTERQPIVQGIEDVEDGQPAMKGEKFIQNGQLYIRCGEQVFDVMGRLVK